MFFNYFKIAFRHLKRNKLFASITIFGLTLGFLSFGLLGLYVHDELSYDSFHRDADRIYRVVEHRQEENGVIRHVTAIGAQVAHGLKEQSPQVEAVLNFFSNGRATMGNDPLARGYERLFNADSNFFNFFDFRLIAGDPATALTRPNTLVMSENAALKYFGTTESLGKTVWVNGTMMEVTGIMENSPANSNFEIPVLFSVSTWTSANPNFKTYYEGDWTSNGFAAYIKLEPGAAVDKVENDITNLVKSKYEKLEEFKSTFELQPLKTIHTTSTQYQANEMYARSAINPFYIYMFISVAFLILLIACLNYMNLSTAAAIKRTREIGTRKSLGALKAQLVTQFTSEALFLSLISLVIAVALLQVALPQVNAYTGKNLQVFSLEPQWIIVGLLTMVGAGLLSSLYPTFIIARVSPAAAMKKEIRLGNSTLPVRKGLIVLQFTISIIMIACTIVIFNQLNFMRSAELGLNVENLVVIDINSPAQRGKFEEYKAAFSQLPEVSSVSVSSRVPGEWKDFPVVTANASGSSSDNIFVGVDHDFLTTFQIDLLQGRNFTSSIADSSKVLLSKLAVAQLRLENPIGTIIEIPTARFGGQRNTYEQPFRAEVIGVVDDFHFQSMRSEMMPLILGYWTNPIQRIDYYTLRVRSSNLNETLRKFQEVNLRLDPDNPVEHTFLDQRFKEFYEADALRGRVFLGFSLLIILIASMGLFALVSYSVENRTKEIGIRKVLGASVQNIVGMISKEFLLLVVIATVLAVPATMYFISKWLQDFAYRAPVGAWVFIVAGVITILIAGITIGARSIRAAMANPVKSLRSE